MVAYVRKLASRAGVFHVTATLRYTRAPHGKTGGPKEDGVFVYGVSGSGKSCLHAAGGGVSCESAIYSLRAHKDTGCGALTV